MLSFLLLLLTLSSGPTAAVALGSAAQEKLQSTTRTAAPDSGARTTRDSTTSAALNPNHAAPGAAVAVAPAPALAKLRSDVDGLLGRVGWPDNRWAVLVVSLDRGDTLYAHSASQPLAPASNMKLFTAAAALYYLGPAYRFGTYLVTDGRIEGDVLAGDLIVYGTGDPTISDRFYESKLAVWEALADSLAALGIREIRGDVVGDGSYFGGRSTGVGWQLDYMDAWYAAPAGALSFNDNMVTLHIVPAAEPARRPEIQFIPGGRGIALVNLATTTASGGTRIHVDRASYDGPIFVEGTISAADHAGVWRAVPVADPPRYAAIVLREVLEKRGIHVTGGVRSIHDPLLSRVTARRVFAPTFDGGQTMRTLAVHRSPPLLEILEVINKKSHNLYAEQVLRTVGRVAVGDGSAAGGAKAVQRLLARETDADALGLRMVDGSGLSVLNRADPRTIVALLDYMARSPFWNSFWATLPEAGSPDGLHRMHETPAEHNLRAKTGTINHVSALSGYVRGANGERLAFSIISNGVPSTWRAKRVEDAIGARLASFTRAPLAAPAGAVAAAAPAAAAAAAAQSSGTDTTTIGHGQSTPPGSAPDVPAGGVHVIHTGDTLEAIAKSYGTTVQALVHANPGVEPKRLIPGQTLQLP